MRRTTKTTNRVPQSYQPQTQGYEYETIAVDETHLSISLSEIHQHAPGIVAALIWADQPGIKASDVHVVGEDTHPWVRRGSALDRVDEAQEIQPHELTAVASMIGAEGGSKMLQMDNVRWRITVFGSYAGLRLACRRIPTHPPKLEQLGIDEQIRRLTSRKQGLIITSGSTGSGKTTTLASLLNTINLVRYCHILTIEDPIEYIYPPGRSLVSQREIAQSSSDYTEALGVALRSDIDVVLLGECITPEQFIQCMRLAATGHLVMTTMHAKDCVTTCQRIISMTGETGQTMLAQTLLAIVSQRLVPSKEDSRRRYWVGESLFNNFVYSKLLSPGAGYDPNKIHQQLETDKRSMDQKLATLVQANKISEEAAKDEAVNLDRLDHYLSLS